MESVSLDKTEIELTEGDEEQLTATIAPENASNKNVSWSSSDEEVGTVSSGGKVTAVKAGTATITVTTEDGGKAATCNVTVILPEGALPGEFSVSATKKVHFSKGNLVATINASGAPTAWKFAANQYDYLGGGGANETIGTAAGDIDLFVWSTAATTYGISTSTSTSDYSGDFVDWGTAIDNKGTWHTLSTDEWEYLRSRRTNAKNLYKCGVTVCGKTNCLIIAPDGFTGTIADSYDATSWSAAETAGLVCLPPAGDRYSRGTQNDGNHGNYWTPDHASDSYSSFICVESDSFSTIFYEQRFCGYSVRLITDVK